MLSSNHMRSTGLYRTSHLKQGGTGIISDIQHVSDKIFKLRPKILNDFVIDKGDLIITNLDVCRIPVFGLYEKLLNVLTFGQMKKKMIKRGYDKLYHMYLEFTLSDGSIWSLEKNQRVNVIKGTQSNRKGSECRHVKYGKKTLKNFIETSEKANIKDFYTYNFFEANCQRFVENLLNTNGVTVLDKFIVQNISDLAPRYVRLMAKPLLSTAAVLDFLQRGGADDEKKEEGKTQDELDFDALFSDSALEEQRIRDEAFRREQDEMLADIRHRRRLIRRAAKGIFENAPHKGGRYD